MNMSVLLLRQVLFALTLIYATGRDLEQRLEEVPRNTHHEWTTKGVPSIITTVDEPPQTVPNSNNNNIVTSIHRHTQKYEAIQRRVLQRTVEAVMNGTSTTTAANRSSASSSFYRSNSIQRICSPDANGVVFPDDDFNIQLFRSDAEPMCSCYERDNTDLVLFSLVNDNSANVTEYLQKLNKAFSRIVGVIQYECVNTCEHCFTLSDSDNESDASFCGILQTNESSTYRGTEGNFSMKEYSTGQITAASWERLFSESSFSISTCIEYTKNEVGTLCFGSHFWNLSTTPTCYVQYNDTLCQSCSFPYSPINDVNVTNNDCFIVDCTNIDPDASIINTCNGTGYNGIFRFVELIENGVLNNSTSVTVGSCDGPPTMVPIAAPVSVEQAAPSSLVSTPTVATSGSSSSVLRTSIPFTVWICTLITGVTALRFSECI
jgi:hypothetical protein